MSQATETKRLVGRRAEKARAAYLLAAELYIRAKTPDQRIRREAECRRLAIGLDQAEVAALTHAASRTVARGA